MPLQKPGVCLSKCTCHNPALVCADYPILQPGHLFHQPLYKKTSSCIQSLPDSQPLKCGNQGLFVTPLWTYLNVLFPCSRCLPAVKKWFSYIPNQPVSTELVSFLRKPALKHSHHFPACLLTIHHPPSQGENRWTNPTHPWRCKKNPYCPPQLSWVPQLPVPT